MNHSSLNLFLLFLASVLVGSVVNMDLFGFQDRSGVEVIDCRENKFECNSSRITERVSSCGSWRPWNPRSQLDCNYTSKNLSEISLVSDAANYVDRSLKDSHYSVEQEWKTGAKPWDLEFMPSGEPIWTAREGKLRRVSDGKVKVLDELDVVTEGENGLLGLAIHPEYQDNRFIYLYYTYNVSNRETLIGGRIFQQRISRFRLSNGSLHGEKVVVEVPGSKYHSGGRLEFGPENNLFVSTGDANMEYDAVNNSFLGGKILRLNPDGSVPEDNPFNNSIYSLGHRNPQGLAWSPEGTLYNTEHGQWRHDEINQVVPGQNYGWSYYECDDRHLNSFSHNENLSVPAKYNKSIDPVHCWEDYTMAPSGATFVNDTGSPWHGDLFVAGLRGAHIARFGFSDEQIENHDVFYVSGDEPNISLRFRDVEYHEGSLYVIGDRRGMVKIKPESGLSRFAAFLPG